MLAVGELTLGLAPLGNIAARPPGEQMDLPEIDVDELIDTSEIIDELPFVRLEHVIEYKQVRSSPKDLLHLEQYEVATSAAKT